MTHFYELIGLFWGTRYYIIYSFTGGSECDICHIGPLQMHRVKDEVLS